jgi:phosphate transport system substrate-binding protein
MSREMKSEEIDQFKAKYGVEPTRIAVAIDALAVFVHKDNPVKEFTLQELDGIFSKTWKSGNKAIKTWGEAGVKGELAGRPISIYGRNSASGTYGYFKEHALFKGDYKDTVKEQPGSSAVVQSVSTDKFAIGYSGIGYVTSGVRAVPLADAGKWGGQAFAANYENALNGKYPLARYLYIYINRPKDGLEPVVGEFIKFVLSKQGQEIVVKDGYLPLTADLSGKERGKL